MAWFDHATWDCRNGRASNKDARVLKKNPETATELHLASNRALRAEWSTLTPTVCASLEDVGIGPRIGKSIAVVATPCLSLRLECRLDMVEPKVLQEGVEVDGGT